MTKEFVSPNLHVILIHYPLGLLIIGTLIELFSFLWRRTHFRIAGRWMILIGALSAAPASTSGLYAMWDVNRSSDAIDLSWAEVRQTSPVPAEAWEMMQRHAWLNAFATGTLLLLVVIWLACSNTWRARLHVVFLLVLLASLGTVVIGAWFGGEMIFRHGVGVQTSAAEAVSSMTEAVSESAAPTPSERIAYFIPPIQVHVILAGSLIALAMAALGVSLRRGVVPGSEGYDPAADSNDIGAALGTPLTRPRVPLATSHEHDAFRGARLARRPPAARFWLITSVLAIATAVSGVWIMEVWDPRAFVELITDTSASGGAKLTRLLAHFIAGTALIVLPLLLALVTRFMIGRRLILMMLGLLLVAFAGAQVWLGSLLMFDTSSGAITRFNASESPSPATESAGDSTSPSTSTTSPALP